jgi:regulator of RNase E activity RraA
MAMPARRYRGAETFDGPHESMEQATQLAGQLPAIDPSWRPNMMWQSPIPVTDLSTCVISDALDEVGAMGVLSGIRNQTPVEGVTMGQALPVRFVPKLGDPDAYRFGGGVGRPLQAVLESIESGQIPCFDLGGSTVASPWGELASRLAIQRDVPGTVVWGSCRDVGEIEALGYPIWASSVSPRRSRNDFTFGSIGESIEVCGVPISTGDIVAADRSGVVVIPKGLVDDVFDIVERILKQEAELLRQLDDGGPIDWDAV